MTKIVTIRIKSINIIVIIKVVITFKTNNNDSTISIKIIKIKIINNEIITMKLSAVIIILTIIIIVLVKFLPLGAFWVVWSSILEEYSTYHPSLIVQPCFGSAPIRPPFRRSSKAIHMCASLLENTEIFSRPINSFG